MSVTIGEFEVVPSAPPAPAPEPPSPATTAAPDPLELARALEQLRELTLRTWAH